MSCLQSRTNKLRVTGDREKTKSMVAVGSWTVKMGREEGGGNGGLNGRKGGEGLKSVKRDGGNCKRRTAK